MHRLDPVPQIRLAWRQGGAQRFQVHLERGERLAELVVQLARSAAALGLEGFVGGFGQAAQRLLRAPDFLLGAPALGDVAMKCQHVLLSVDIDCGRGDVQRHDMAVLVQLFHFEPKGLTRGSASFSFDIYPRLIRPGARASVSGVSSWCRFIRRSSSIV